MINPTAPIHQFMTRPVPTVTPETAVSEAWQMMEDNRLRYLPVVSQGRVVGILGARPNVIMDDFGIFSSEEGPVQSAMMPEPASVPSGCPLRDVVHTMAHEQIPVVLIVDGVELKGMFTDTDALRLLAMMLSS